MILRRIAAVPLIALGALIYAGLTLTVIAIDLYVAYLSISRVIDGQWIDGLLTFLIGGTAFTLLLGFLTIPAGGLLAAGEWLWGTPTATPMDPDPFDLDEDWEVDDEDEFDDEDLDEDD